MFTYCHHDEETNHIHNYHLIVFDFPDQPYAYNILHNYPKFHNYYITISRECHSEENCADKWTHVSTTPHILRYKKFVDELDKFVEDLGANGKKIVERFQADIQDFVLEKFAKNFVEADSDEEYVLLQFPNFLPPISRKWNEELPNGEVIEVVEILKN
jgi:hypothetical protein